MGTSPVVPTDIASHLQDARLIGTFLGINPRECAFAFTLLVFLDFYADLCYTLPVIKLTDRQNKKMLLTGTLIILLGALSLFTVPKINAYIKTNEFIQEAQAQTSTARSQSASVISAVTDNTDPTETTPLKEIDAQKVNTAKIITAKANIVATDPIAQIRAQAAAEKVANEAAIESELQSGAQTLRDAETIREAKAANIIQTNTAYLNQLSAINKSFSIDGLDLYNSAINSYNSGNDSAAIATLGQARAVFQEANIQALSLSSNFPNMPKDYVQAGEDMKNATYNAVKATDEIISVIGTHATNTTSKYGEQLVSYGEKVRSFLISQGFK